MVGEIWLLPLLWMWEGRAAMACAKSVGENSLPVAVRWGKSDSLFISVSEVFVFPVS